jgi:uncharacterized delta-60 repeat protein
MATGIAVTLGNPGTLDTSFSGDGKLTASVGTGSSIGARVLVQPDGKILVGAESNNGDFSDFTLLRYNANGSTDSAFGSAGKLTVAFGSGDDYLYGLALQPNGGIVASGTTWPGDSFDTDGDAALVRFTGAGLLDGSFGSGGKVVTPIGSGDDGLAFGSAVQPDGKIVVAGFKYNSATDSDIAVLRYTTGGVLDSSFGSGGKVTTSLGSGEDAALALVLQPDGKIVVAGGTDSADDDVDFALVRYTTTGALDPGFGTSGRVITEIGPADDAVAAIALQADGKILVAGITDNGHDSDIVLLRYLTNGSLDTSFGAGGKVITALSSENDIAFGIAVQPDGRIVLAAASDPFNNGDFVALCYRPDGSLDTRFDGDGIARIEFGAGIDSAAGIALQEDGRIVLTGQSWTGSHFDIAVARLFGTSNLVKGTAADDTLAGASGDDTIKGNGGVDILKGGAGTDMLYGGTGNDKLTGGTGADKFVFDTALASNKDSIIDFKPGEHDKILLDNDIFTKLGAPKALALANFAVEPAAQDANDYIVYKPSTGALYYDSNGNAAGGLVQFATLGTTTHPTLHNTDFVIVG